MALTLTENIDEAATVLEVTGTVEADIGHGYLFRIGTDAELLELRNFAPGPIIAPTVQTTRVGKDPNVWLVKRGPNATSHTAGAEILGVVDAYVSGDTEELPGPFAEGGGGGPVAASDVYVDPPVKGGADVLAALQALEQTAIVSETEPTEFVAGTMWLRAVTMPDASIAYAIRIRNADNNAWTEPAQVHLDAMDVVRSFTEYVDGGIEHYVFRADGTKYLEVQWNASGGGFYYKVFAEGADEDAVDHIASFIGEAAGFEAHVIPSGEGVDNKGRRDFRLLEGGVGITADVYDSTTGNIRATVSAYEGGIDITRYDATGAATSGISIGAGGIALTTDGTFTYNGSEVAVVP